MAEFCSDRWSETHSNQLTKEYGNLADYWKELKILKEMKKVCQYCGWRMPSEYLTIENDWCQRGDREVEPQQCACENFIFCFIGYFS